MWSATKSGGPSAEHADVPSSEETPIALERSNSIRGPEEDLNGRAEDACSMTSSGTWHHVEPLDDIISASDSEGREVYARGVSPGRPLSSKGLQRPPIAAPSFGPSIAKEAEETENLSTPASASDKGLKSRSGEKHSSKRAASREGKQDREAVPAGPNAQSHQQSLASGQDITVHKAGPLDANAGVTAKSPTVEGTRGEGFPSQDDLASISAPPSTATNDKEDEGSGRDSVTKSQMENAQGSGSPDQRPGAWGWSSWSKLTEQFREAASGAARDVQELTTSFQQVTQAVQDLKPYEE